MRSLLSYVKVLNVNRNVKKHLLASAQRWQDKSAS